MGNLFLVRTFPGVKKMSSGESFRGNEFNSLFIMLPRNGKQKRRKMEKIGTENIKSLLCFLNQ